MFGNKGQSNALESSERYPRPSIHGGRRRIAALEIGEQACELLVVEAFCCERPYVLERLVEPVGTGLIGSDGRFVDGTALDRLWRALNWLGKRAVLHDANELLALATPSLALQEDCLLVMSEALGARLTLLDDVTRVRLNSPVATDLLSCAHPPLLVLDLGSESLGLLVMDEVGERYSTSAWLGRPAQLAGEYVFQADDPAAHASLVMRTRALVRTRVASAMRREAGQFLIISSMASAIRRLSLQVGTFDRGKLAPDEISLATLEYLEEKLLAMSSEQQRCLTEGKQASEDVLRAILVARTVLELTGMLTVFLRPPRVLDGFVGKHLKVPLPPAPFAYIMD